MEKIVSRNNPKVKDAYSLKGNSKTDRFLVEGFHTVEMAYKAGLLISVFSTKEIQYTGVTTYLVTQEIIEKLASTKTPEGIVGICNKKKNSLSIVNKLIYLDNVQDPANVGSISRTALAFGFKDILLSKGCASIYNPKTIISSQGAIFSLSTFQSSFEDLQNLKKEGFKIISTCLKDSTSFDSFECNEEKIVIVLGNEGQGINKDILDISDYKLRIDIANIDSLNVSVAAGIILNKFKNI